MQHFSEFEYIVVNDEAIRATEDLRTIILADRLKRVRQSRAIQVILNSFDATKNHAIGE